MRFRVGHNARGRTAGIQRWAEEDRGFDTPCWIWLLAKQDGYGVWWLNGGTRRAHRVPWEAENGPVPAGLQLDHLCRQRDCVNPAHLELVTNAQNSRRGKKAKLTMTAAEAIRQRYRSGATRGDLAARFGVTTSTIDAVTHGRTWLPE